jgi:hypothetical protein
MRSVGIPDDIHHDKPVWYQHDKPDDIPLIPTTQCAHRLNCAQTIHATAPSQRRTTSLSKDRSER